MRTSFGPHGGLVLGGAPVERAARALADARLAANLPGAAARVTFEDGTAAVLASESGAFWLLLDDPIALLAIAVAIKASAANTTSSGRNRARSLTLDLPS
jgi:hypothetical protein